MEKNTKNKLLVIHKKSFKVHQINIVLNRINEIRYNKTQSDSIHTRSCDV